ncbi:S8 family peptidase [Granulosicoccus antarcticus]|uniref:Peptidase S8/S53 domain-containing protein n=1 Tax=Granulosicoccus antarcticus IMCC3135 TaxID=1192854 RepID=A0A2Z2NXN3_9GAMM|nr:S8 family serine peptidase [Granulosicoccus antarcticus]ASJ75235.1 hypothetical protein IMCC3135_25900 [Granulosicoccus antarcticus IMCC3135]
MPEALQILQVALVTTGVLLAGFARAQDPPLPPAEPLTLSGSVRVTLVDSGVNYQLPAINARLARQEDGTLVGYDFWDMDKLPYDASPDAQGRVQRHGTRTASVLLREAPFVELVPYRYPRPDMRRMAELLDHAARHQVRIIGMPLGGNRQEDWQAFAVAAQEHPDMLFIVSAGNNGRDIDQQPVYPAALDLPNMLVVTSADDFGLLADGVNWGRGSVDYMVPAEFVPVTRFDGSPSFASGSSYAVPRVAALAARLIRDKPSLSVAQLLTLIRNRFANGAAPAQLKSGYLYDPRYDPEHEIEITSVDSWESSRSMDDAQMSLALDVMILDDAWTQSEVGRVLERAETLLSVCGIRFSAVQLRQVSAPDYLRDLETGASRTLMDAVRLSGADKRVAVVFARDTGMSTPFDAEAFGKGNTRSRSWLTDSVWLTLALQDRDIALAHELFHVLSNSGAHVQSEANLMLDRTTGSNRTLEAAQCELARTVSLEAGLTVRVEK